MTRAPRLTAFAAAAALALGAFTLPGATAEPEASACTEPASPAGEWPTYGGDLRNSRSQPAEATLGLTEALTIEPAFVYQASGTIQNTPIVDGGCVFVAAQDGSNAARISAIDADLGTPIWSTRITVGTPSFGGSIVGSPGLYEDLVIAYFNKNADPFLAAFDRSTGEERWRTPPGGIDTQSSTGTNAGVVVYDGLVFAGFFGSAFPAAPERGGFVLVEAATGQVIKKTFSIPDADFAEGYGGAGIWATAAIDEDTGFAYVGTSNPHTPQKIHPISNSILKIDLNRDSPNFGEIVDSYQGLRDTLVPGIEDNPACDVAPDVNYYETFSLTCFAIDIDFGSSPNLIKTDDGRTLVGNLQKAGIYHVVDTADMSGLSMTPAGPPCFACNAASTAYVDGRAFVPAGPPGQMVAVDVATGLPMWAGHLTGALTYNAATHANGLVWTVDSGGFLDAFDALTGAQIVKRPLQTDTGASMVALTSSSGIAVARNTLYVAATRYVIGYRVGPSPIAL